MGLEGFPWVQRPGNQPPASLRHRILSQKYPPAQVLSASVLPSGPRNAVMQLLLMAASHYSLEPEGQFEVRPGRSEREQVQTLPGIYLVAGCREPLAVTPG